MSKKKVKVWGKIKLFETSAVGIPAYPDAHASADVSYSLIKSLSKAAKFCDECEEIGEQLNIEQEVKKMTEGAKVENTAPAVTEVEKSLEVKAETPVEKAEVNVDMIKSIVKDAIKEALKASETERGLLAKEETKMDVSKMSLGECAVASGLFKAY